MPLRQLLSLLVLITTSGLAMAQKDINGASNSDAEGISLDTNVSFTLSMTLAGDDTPLESATIGQEVSIKTIIRPETEDIGQAADIIIVDYLPPALNMRNSDGNFVSWNGSLKTLVPYLEGVTLEDEQEVEVFSGMLGSTGNHRIFVGFTVGDILYFTPTALRFDIEDDVVTPTFREQAIELFNSTISPTIVQSSCVACHVAGGSAAGQADHIFVRTTNPDHLTINFEELESLHASTSTDYILNKSIGLQGHGGGAQISNGGTAFNNFSDFLNLLDQAAAE